LSVRIIDSEGTIEEAVKEVYKAMVNKERAEITLQYLCTTDFIHTQFLKYLAKYIGIKKPKKVTHVKIDIFIEEKS
jgi:hypothetical protein